MHCWRRQLFSLARQNKVSVLEQVIEDANASQRKIGQNIGLLASGVKEEEKEDHPSDDDRET